MHKIFTLIMLCVLSFSAFAQDRTITGKVISQDDGSPVPGVNVVIEGTTTGTSTDADGSYSLAVPSGDVVLVYSFIGLKAQRILVGERSVIDIQMVADVEQLSEVIVTGVAEGTSSKKLGFSVGKVNENLLAEAPAMDAGNALRGKVAGVQIVQSSGTPGTAGSINLRGTTALSGSGQGPLIIIDGIITPPGSSNLADLNMNDVESVEVIKGAAGASLYGSLAANGVVQIITKRGAKQVGETRVTFRTEYGINRMLRKVELSEHHSFLLDANGDYVLDENGVRVEDPEQIYDNPYPGGVIDQQEEVFSGRSYSNNYVSIASTLDKTNFFASFDNTVQEGLVEGQDPFDRKNIRLNVDHYLNDQFKLSLSGGYVNSKGINPQEGSQTGFIYGTLLWEPDYDLRTPNPDGQPFITVSRPIGNFSNANNPLYVAHNNQRIFERERLLGGATASYELFNWWRVEGQISLDRANYNEDRLQDKDYLSQSNPNGNGGQVDKRNQINQARVINLSSYFNRSFGDFNGGLTFRYITEEYLVDFMQTLGTNLASKGIFQLDNVDRTTLVSTSSQETFRAENFMINGKFDFKDRYILDALFRIDQSSLFGADVRSKAFYRASLAYRISEDLQINGIDEWKIRASIGTSGQRPPFEAQYETYTVQGGSLVPDVLGNKDLKPSVVTEVEIGTNINFLGRFNLELNYANSEAADQILQVPLSGLAGFTTQFQNAGTIESTAYEMALSANIIDNPSFKWDVGVTATRTRSEITALNRPAYLLNVFNNTPIFNIEEGETLGAIHGNLLASSVSELTTDENGFVNNLAGLNDQLTPSDFVVNSEGYLVQAGTENTADEVAYHLLDDDGNRLVRKIGDTNPDVILGFHNSFNYKNFNVFFSMDAQIGGDIANVMRQNLLFNGRAGEVDQSGFAEGQRKYVSYLQSTSNSGNGLNQRFVEGADYIAMREFSVSYTLGNSFIQKLGGISKVLYDAKISLIGRNLFMITDYSGFTPDVSSRGSVAAGNVDQDVLLNPTIFRADVYGYPMFRSLSASLQVRF